MSNLSNQTTSTPQNNKPSVSPIIIVAGILALIVIGFLTYSNVSKSGEIDQKVAELQEAEELRIELEQQYNASIAELEEFRVNNEELETLIAAQKDELEQQRSKIAGLIGNKKKLNSARKELKNMKAQLEEYVARIEQLQSENATLADVNAQLGLEKDQLTTELQTQVVENAQLSEAKAVLVSEKTQLTEENQALTKTVNLASVVKVDNIQVDGFKLKDGGKAARKKAAKSINDLQVCFETTVNEVTNPGDELFYVRILNPLGETLAIEDMGSGMTKNLKTGDEIRYTQATDVAYQNDVQNACIHWTPGSKFQSGKYTVEIFNKGHLAGSTTFSLK